MNMTECKAKLNDGALNDLFGELYGEEAVESQVKRYAGLLDGYEAQFGLDEVSLFSTPGRTELGGNHTDHNHGKVLAGSIQLDTIAAVRTTGDMVVELVSEGYPPVRVDLSRLAPVDEEEGKTDALVRGIAARFVELDYNIGGFQAFTTSNVLKGSGLSSSAALEVLVGTLFSHLYNAANPLDPVLIAQIGQYAENTFFGKPCGLMDQVACAHGGIVSIDFRNPAEPVVDAVSVDFSAAGYQLLVVDTGGNHADLTPDYAAVPTEMKSVAEALGQEVCREVDHGKFIKAVSDLRGKVGDRAILRCIHFMKDNERVGSQIEALREGDIASYLQLVQLSGDSSWKMLQNCFSPQNHGEQGISLALALTEDFLDGEGASRVHGGGFAGTIQVYMPLERVADYTAELEAVFGPRSVTPLRIRKQGSIRVL
ncbi:MAG: galactokinase [Planctomycetota bacterium]|jgi:galactokinase